jgi:hypothetical protein
LNKKEQNNHKKERKKEENFGQQDFLKENKMNKMKKIMEIGKKN